MRYSLLVLSLGLLIFNIMFIGILKTNVQGLTEIFIKHRPTIENVVFISSQKITNEDKIVYKDFILDHNIQDKSKSLLAIFLIQLMISCAAIGISKIEFKRQLVLLLIHLIGGFFISLFAFPFIAGFENGLMMIMGLICLIIANVGFKYILTN